MTGDITLLAEDGTVIAQVFGFTCRFLPRIPRHDEHQRRLYTRTWVPLEAAMSDLREEQRAAMSDLREEQRAEAASSAPVSWLVLRDGDIQPVLDELSAQSEPVYLVDLRWASEPADSPSPVEDGAAIARSC